MPLNSIQAILDHLGVGSVAQINTPNNYAFTYPINWTTAIGTQTSDAQSVTIDTDSVFLVYNMLLLPIRTVDEEGGVLGEGPGWREVQTPDITQTFERGFSLSHFRLEIRAGSVQWQSDPVSAAAWCSIPGGQIVPLHVPVIAAGATVRCTLYNDSDNVAPTVQLNLVGARFNKNG